MKSELSILLISVGNTRTVVALASGDRLEQVSRAPNSELSGIVDTVQSLLEPIRGGERLVLVATVNKRVSEALSERVSRIDDVRVLRLGTDLPIPVGICLDPEARTGQDRLLNAAAAFDRFGQACVIVDAGTAVTIDFVDGEGTFHGGAIAPGAQMQLDAMHSATDALPQITMKAPDPESFGANTTQAMLHGVFHGIRGMVRHLTERYAEAYQAYPTVIATGGDAHLLFDEDELVERVIDDLPLHGMLAAYRIAQKGLSDDEA